RLSALGVGGWVVRGTAPPASVNCPSPPLSQPAGPPSGSLFPAGVTTITYTATDAGGLTATCTFTVTVSPDTQPPSIVNCPVNIGPVPMDAGVCGAVDSWTAPTASDNCPSPTLSQTAGPCRERVDP